MKVLLLVSFLFFSGCGGESLYCKTRREAAIAFIECKQNPQCRLTAADFRKNKAVLRQLASEECGLE